ncbi:hypothetical protein A8M77_17945 [Variovorax sp. JS1663]|nr:hypothetical protein A8M77_17945 [Variovorax sp. JS1663]
MFVVNIDGSNVVDLGPGSAPAWSDEGTRIALSSNGLYVVNAADGSQRTLITNDLEVDRISWSGGGLVFSKLVATPGVYDTFRVNPDGSSRELFRPAGASPLGEPSWYPHPNAAIAVGSGARCLYKTNTSSAVQVLSTCNQAYPSVSPDGSSVLSTAIGSNNLVVSPLSGASPQTVAQFGLQADWGRRPRTAMLTTLASGQWSTPAALAGDTDAYTAASAVTVMPDNGSMGQTLQQVVSVGSDGRAYHRAQRVDGSWTPNAPIPGVGGSSAGFYARRVAIGGAKDGSAQMVVVGWDDLVYHGMRYANGSWSGMNLLDGADGAANFAARDAAIAICCDSSTSPGAAQVVANGLATGPVFHRARLSDGRWLPFQQVTGLLNSTRLAVAVDAATSNTYVLATAAPLGIVRQLRYANGAWDAWIASSNSAGATDVSLAISNNAGSVVAKVAYVDSLGQLQYLERADANRQYAWTLPLTTQVLMPNARSVSVSNTAAGAEVLAAQMQPQQ